MLPRWHIFWGMIFTGILWFLIPNISFTYLLIIFLSSFLIDFDHYICSVIKSGKISLFHSFNYHKEMGKTAETERKEGIRRKGDFHLFHTIEFHILIALIGLFSTSFFYVFIGMTFHSLLDIFYLINKDYVYRREYFFFNWLGKKIIR